MHLSAAIVHGFTSCMVLLNLTKKDCQITCVRLLDFWV